MYLTDETKNEQYRKQEGIDFPDSDPPSRIFQIEKVTGEVDCRGYIQALIHLLIDMLALLTKANELRIVINEMNENRHRCIQGPCLQTSDPAA